MEPTDRTTLYDLAGLKLELEALLGVGVDIATPRALDEGLAGRIVGDLRLL